jgi:pyruvate,water dikinase
VPNGFAILPAAFVDDKLTAEAWEQVKTALLRLRPTSSETAFAVRSSAMSEDSAQASFAGEFETVLNARTDEEVRQAIHVVYHSRTSERVQAYTQAKGMASTLGDGAHQIAVIIQQLVPAECSGVLFTANPVSGQRDQAMVSASWGLGEAIVGGLVTPDTLIVDKGNGQVLSRETADKKVMTVLLEEGTEEQPVPEAKRREPVLSDERAAELVALGGRIEALYGMPMDIEWTLVDEFAIVQARPITALPEETLEPVPEPLAPTEWKLPEGAYIAMRNNIVELMANPLTPLFGTLGRDAVNTSMSRQLTSFFGRSDIMPGELIVTVNEYAYYNGSLRAGQMARILLGSVGIAKRMFTGAVERWTETGRPHYIAMVEAWQAREWQELPATELLAAARELAEAAIDAYWALVSGVIPAAWISEALFTFVYKTLIKRRTDPTPPTYLLGFDSLPIRAEKALYDLAQWASERAALAGFLKDTPTAQLIALLDEEGTPLGLEQDDWEVWQSRFQAHLGRYGHTIYDLDFASPVPADDPAPLLDTFKVFLSGQGGNPYERQQASAEQREQATQAQLGRLKGLRLRWFRSLLARAQRYAPLREDGLADVGLSYPLLRQMFRELGQRLVEGGLIEAADDIYWLGQAEVEDAARRSDRGEALSALHETVGQRKTTWQAARRVTPPMMLPQIKFFGKDMEQIKAARAKKRAGDTLKGVAASPGRVTAPACILHGPEDFSQMKDGDVLVAPITTPAWTPLFVRASAVVTDVGGPLSHGSIVAREYGIPAVLGTDTASETIRNGQEITVDGSEGRVYLTPV